MSDFSKETEIESHDGAGSGVPRWMGLAVACLAAICIVALGVGWTAASKANNAEQTMAARVATLDQTASILGKRLSQAEETNAQVKGELSVVADRLKLTRGELDRARKQTKQIREDYAKDLAQVEDNVKSELATKASADDVNTRVGALNGDIAGVRGDLDSTKQNIQLARGELGTLIAHNHEEIEQLRRLGQRDYFEFTVDKKGTKQKLGNVVTIELRGTNPRRNLYSLAFYVDDMRLEKKNRSLNEPIYFYTRSTRAPFELVVNQIGKNRVVGYLSVPKGAAAVAASNSGL